jgi:hypothetical protein
MALKIHSGVVTNNNDPEQRGRVKFSSDTLLGTDTEYPIWAEPASWTSKGGLGALLIPDVDSTIDVLVDDEDDEYIPRYMGGVYNDDSGVPDEMKSGYPKVRGIKTPSGHLVMLDDAEKKITIKDANGNEFILESGKVNIKTSGDLTIEGANINIGEGAAYNVPYAQTLHAALNVQFSMLGGHYHMVSSEGAPTGPPVPKPPGFPGAGDWSSSTVKVK